jgi:hypothetical protein
MTESIKAISEQVTENKKMIQMLDIRFNVLEGNIDHKEAISEIEKLNLDSISRQE